VPVDAFPVRESDGMWPGAGPARNSRMLTVGSPTHGIAFPGGSGTANMRRQFDEWPYKTAPMWVILP
jgi:hypothetical protein